jgi:hypothetical protein
MIAKEQPSASFKLGPKSFRLPMRLNQVGYPNQRWWESQTKSG